MSLKFIIPSAVEVPNSDMVAIREWLFGEPSLVCVETTKSDEIWSIDEIEGFTLSHDLVVCGVMFFGHVVINGVPVRAVAHQDACPMTLFI